MPESVGATDSRPLLSKTVLPLSAWILYGFFFFNAFLAGREKLESVWLGALALAVCISLTESPDFPGVLEKVRLKDPVLSAAGALLVYQGVRQYGLTPAIACALVGVFAGFIGLSGDGSRQTYAGPIYCGGFAGMTSSLILVNPWWVAGAGLVAGYFYSVSGPLVRGIGGKMGSTAFGGVIVMVLAAKWAMLSGPGAKPIPLDSAENLGVLIASLCSAPISYWLAHGRGLGVILGSALPSAVVAIAVCLPGHWVPPGAAVAATAWFGSSFVGMTLPHRIGTRHWLLPLMGLLFGVLWIGFRPPLVGVGGGLGATAAISVLGVLGVVRFVTLTQAYLQSLRRRSWST